MVLTLRYLGYAFIGVFLLGLLVAGVGYVLALKINKTGISYEIRNTKI
jgi:hypothetical protein